MMDPKECIEKKWPQWEVGNPIGTGLYGTVFEAKCCNITGETEYAAIKVIPFPRYNESLASNSAAPDQSQDSYARMVEKCADQIAIMKTIRHCKSIVSLDDFALTEDDDEKTKYLLLRMELLTPVEQYIAQAPFDEKKVIKLGIELCHALETCCMHSIVHWDIKPENVFVDSFGNFKLSDFAIASNIRRWQENGASDFMADEMLSAHASGQSISAASQIDIYSLGKLLYWCANQGALPFERIDVRQPFDGEATATSSIPSGEDSLPPLSQISKPLMDVIYTACGYRSENRYFSAAEFRTALEALNSGKKQNKPSGIDENTLTQAIDHDSVLDKTVGPTERFPNDPDKTVGPAERFPNDPDKTVGPAERFPANPESTIAEHREQGRGFTTSIQVEIRKLKEKSADTGKKEKPKEKRGSVPEPFRYNDWEDVPTPPPQKKLDWRICVIIASVAVLILAGVIFGIWLWKNNQSNQSENSSLETASETSAPITETASESVQLSGDVNGDNIVDIKDVIRLQKYIAGNSVSINTGNSDISGDGKIDASDIALLQKTVSNWDTGT